MAAGGVAASAGGSAWLGAVYGWKAGLAAAVAPPAAGWLILQGPLLLRGAARFVSTMRFPEWGLLLLLLSVSMRFLFPEAANRSIDKVVEDPITAVNLARTVLAGLAGAATILWVGALWGKRRRSAALSGPLGMMLAWGLIALSSTTYSNMPLATAAKSLEILVDVVFFLAVAAFASGRLPRLWNLALGYCALMLAGVWISALVTPGGLGFRHWPGALWPQLTGVVPRMAPNTVGQLGVLLAVVALNRILSRRALDRSAPVMWAGAAAFGLVTVIAAESRTAIVALAAASAVLLYVYRRLDLAACSAVSAVLAVSVLSEELWAYIRRGQSWEAFASLTGRLSFWQEGVRFWLEAPWLGHGFYSGPRFDFNAVYTQGALFGLHNAFLDVLVGVGIVGLIPFTAALVQTARRLTPARRPSRLAYPFRVELLAAFVVLFCRGLAGPAFQTHELSLPLMLVVMALAHAFGVQPRRPAQPARSASLRPSPRPGRPLAAAVGAGPQ